MARQVWIALRSFGRGVKSFVCGWNSPYEPPARDPRGIGRHFERVGVHISKAAETFYTK